jgi:hypothetical protein
MVVALSKECGVAKKRLVSPLSTLKFVWMKEVRVTTPELKVVVCTVPVA